jgi:hypothetical protein
MYLLAETVKATFDVTRTFGAKGSQLVVNHLAVPDAYYLTRRCVRTPTGAGGVCAD